MNQTKKKGQNSILKFCISSDCQIKEKCFIPGKKNTILHLHDSHKVVEIDYFDGHKDSIRKLLNQQDEERKSIELEFQSITHILQEVFEEKIQNNLSNNQKAMRLLWLRKLELINDVKVRDGFQQLSLENLDFLKTKNPITEMKEQYMKQQNARLELEVLLNELKKVISQFRSQISETQTLGPEESEKNVYFIFNRSIQSQEKLSSSLTIEDAIKPHLNVLEIDDLRDTSLIVAPMYRRKKEYYILNSSDDLQKQLGDFMGHLAIYIEQSSQQIGQTTNLNLMNQIPDGGQSDILYSQNKASDQYEAKSMQINSDVQAPSIVSIQYGLNQNKSLIIQEIQNQISPSFIHQQTEDADRTRENYLEG